MNTNSNTQGTTTSHASDAATSGAAGRKVVYVINERNGKSYWTRIGFGSVNKDGSMNLRFDAIPVGGSTVQVRDWEPRDESKFGGTSAASADATQPRCLRVSRREPDMNLKKVIAAAPKSAASVWRGPLLRGTFVLAGLAILAFAGHGAAAMAPPEDAGAAPTGARLAGDGRHRAGPGGSGRARAGAFPRGGRTQD